MDFKLPDEVQQIQDMVRRFVDRELIPIEMSSLEQHKLKADIKERLQRKSKEIGLWMLDTPAEFGGQGLSLLALSVVWEQLARTVALPNRGEGVFGPSPRAILLRLPEAMKERYLHPLLRGEKHACFAQSEPDAGSDPGRMKTRAVRKGDQYIINGHKMWISHAKEADFVQLVASTDPEKGSKGGLSVFIVDMNTPGVKIIGETKHMMGDVTYEIVFDDVHIPCEHLVGEEGQGMREAQNWISRNRVHQASHGLGVTLRCLELIGKYSKERITFGRPIGERQSVQFTIADLYMRYQTGQMLVHRTAWKVDQGISSREDAYMAKLYCTELGFDAADRCMQFYGAMGLSTEMPIEAMWRRSRSYLITGGSAEVMRTVLAREIAKNF